MGRVELLLVARLVEWQSQAHLRRGFTSDLHWYQHCQSFCFIMLHTVLEHADVGTEPPPTPILSCWRSTWWGKSKIETENEVEKLKIRVENQRGRKSTKPPPSSATRKESDASWHAPFSSHVIHWTKPSWSLSPNSYHSSNVSILTQS